MGQQRVEIVRGVYEAFGRGDVHAVLGAMADEFEWYEAEGMPYGGHYRNWRRWPRTCLGHVHSRILRP